MEQFHHPNGFYRRYHSIRNQYLSPHHADEDRQPPRRWNSTSRDNRSDDHSKLRIENEGEIRRARSLRQPTNPKSRNQSRANIGKKADGTAAAEDYHSDNSDVVDPGERQGPETHTLKAVWTPRQERMSIQKVYGEHRLQSDHIPYDHYTQMQPNVAKGQRLANMDSTSSAPRAYNEHHILAANDEFPVTPAQRVDGSAPLAYNEHHVLAADAEFSVTPTQGADRSAPRVTNQSHVPNARPRKTKNQIVPRHEETAVKERGSTEPTLGQQSRHAHAGEYGYMHHKLSSRLPQEDDRPTLRRVSISLRPSADVRTQSYHESSPSNPRPRFNTTTSFPKPQIPRFPMSHDPPDASQSLSFSVGSGDSRCDIEATKRRSRLGSDSTITSTSILSLPTSPSVSSVLGPKSYQYHPLRDMEFRLIRILPERMSKLKCEIVHRSLEVPPDYVAISYAWGDGVDTKPLVLQGATIPVAASLYDALKAIRQKKTEALVWVDALCIDQLNRDERATQVRLMGQIYSRAMSVAIWLGPEADGSALAVQLLEQVAHNFVSPQRIRSLRKCSDSAALFDLFKRDYWKRLWVVQEVLLAENKVVYCGQSILPWDLYRQAADAFWDRDSDPHIRQGPASFPQMSEIMQRGDESLLEVMRTCRKKLSENPRDKVFGILGLLPEATQREFPVDYSQSVKTVYTDVVDYLISTTDQLDVIRESIHFPIHVNTTGLPTWCPDWSHIPEVSGFSRTLGFDASRSREGPTKAQYRFYDERRKLEISAVPLDAIRATGVAVGTFCASQDYLTAFLHWRAILLDKLNIQEGNESHPLHEAFCRALCLGQVPAKQSQPRLWHNICYHVFSSLIREKLPRLPMDEDLEHYANETGLIDPDSRRKFLQDHFGNRMMGRSFCITEQGLIGMGSGYMTAGDLVVVPFGCSTPILLRPEGRRDEYRYVGDVYIEGYMHGEAVQQLEAEGVNRTVVKYMLC